MMLRIYRAESFAGLQEFKLALEDLNAVIAKMPNWPEVGVKSNIVGCENAERLCKILHLDGFYTPMIPQ